MATGSSWLTLHTALIAREAVKMRTCSPPLCSSKSPTELLLTQPVVITMTGETSEYSSLPWLIYLFLQLQGVVSAPLSPYGKGLIPKRCWTHEKHVLSNVCVLLFLRCTKLGKHGSFVMRLIQMPVSI